MLWLILSSVTDWYIETICSAIYFASKPRLINLSNWAIDASAPINKSCLNLSIIGNIHMFLLIKLSAIDSFDLPLSGGKILISSLL